MNGLRKLCDDEKCDFGKGVKDARRKEGIDEGVNEGSGKELEKKGGKDV
ncbi:hypothetical protein [Staphylococcus auricularis]|nr:hypothetical protein [Staphylococcus auricularis]